MKKLLFIIPKVCLLLLFITFSSVCLADTHRYGCWIPGTNFIWHTNDPAHPGSTNFLNDGVTAALNGDDDGYYHKDLRCGNSFTPCTVYWQVSSYHPTGDKRGDGYLADYSIDHCPIDDYLPLLAIFALCLAIIKIRSSSLMFCTDENKLNHGSL